MKEFFGEDYLCTGISLMKRNRKAWNSDMEKLRKKSCYLSRRKYDFGKRNRIRERKRISEIACLI